MLTLFFQKLLHHQCERQGLECSWLSGPGYIPSTLTAGTASRVPNIFFDVDFGVDVRFCCDCCTHVELSQGDVGLEGDEMVPTGKRAAGGRGGRQDVDATLALGIFPEPQDCGSFSVNSFDKGDAEGDRDGDINFCRSGDGVGGTSEVALTGDSSGVGGENVNADGGFEGGKGGRGERQAVESNSHAPPSSPDHEECANVEPKEVREPSGWLTPESLLKRFLRL